MEASSKRAIEQGLAWCGPVFMVGYMYCWAILGHNLPPPNMMAMSAQELVQEYYMKYPSIAPGMMGAATFGLFYTVWSCLLGSLLRDENGAMGPLSFLEIAGGILTGWLLASIAVLWCACSLLAGQIDPGIIKMVHTYAWITFDCTYMITTMQMVGLGLWTVLNKRQTMFPAWAGWTSIAVGISFVALVMMPFVTDGPFAVGGLWNYWIIFGTWFFAFFGVYSYYVLKYVYASPQTQNNLAGRLAVVAA